MSEAHVQLNVNTTAGAKAKTFESVDGDGDVVQVQAVAVTTPEGAPITLATDAAVAATNAALAALQAAVDAATVVLEALRDTAGIKKITDPVAIANWPASLSDGAFVENFDLQVTDPNTIYLGRAPLGAADNAAVWTIQRVTLVGGNPMRRRWSGTTAVWDDRGSEIYT